MGTVSGGVARNSPSEEEAEMLRPRNLSRSERQSTQAGGQQVQRPRGRKQLGELQEKKEGQWKQTLF